MAQKRGFFEVIGLAEGLSGLAMAAIWALSYWLAPNHHVPHYAGPLIDASRWWDIGLMPVFGGVLRLIYRKHVCLPWQFKFTAIVSVVYALALSPVDGIVVAVLITACHMLLRLNKQQ